MIVLDTSAAVACLVGTDSDPRLQHRVGTAGTLHAPHLIDSEFIASLRSLLLRGELGEDRAHDSLLDFARMRIVRYPLAGLLDRIWARRHTMSAYDAGFVTLAEALTCPLVTCDARLARSAPEVTVELYASRP
jgi:predicted nucleic acid-binding protein